MSVHFSDAIDSGIGFAMGVAVKILRQYIEIKDRAGPSALSQLRMRIGCGDHNPTRKRGKSFKYAVFL